MVFSEIEHEVFNCNYKLVEKVIKKYRLSSQDEYDDLFQEGCFGLLKAICKYKGEKNTKFTTFAFTCIDNEIRMYLRRRKRFFRDVCGTLEEAADNDIGEYSYRYSTAYQLYASDDFNPELSLDEKEEKRCLKKVLAALPENEKDLLFSFFGIGGRAKMKQAEIAEKYNISQGRVSMKIKRILSHLQEELICSGYIDKKLMS